jgi:hypothetical protein
MLHNVAPKVAKSCSKVAHAFYCEKCDYGTSKKSSWTKHIQTKKHNAAQMLHNDTPKVAKSCSGGRFECECGKTYKHHQSYYRHKEKCTWTPLVENDKLTEISNDDSITMSKTALTGLVAEMTKALIPVIADSIGGKSSISGSGSNNTINNQKIFNVNLFLNEQCANAMSIQDFAKQLQLTMNDLDRCKPEYLTNVVLKNLRPLAVTDRPFHCTDEDSSKWFVKDIENGWEEDSGDKIITSTEHGIRRQWPSEFEKQHPQWNINEKLQEKYVKIAGNTNAELNKKDKGKVLEDVKDTVLLNNEVIGQMAPDYKFNQKNM